MNIPLELADICNNNKRNMPSDDVYSSFNQFIFSEDTKLLGKLLHRYNFFNDVKHLPGDIVEIGVFKGSGIATFSKFIDIFCPNSNKKIIGFDIFMNSSKNDILEKDGAHDRESMNVVYSKVTTDDLSLSAVQSRLDHMNIHKK